MAQLNISKQEYERLRRLGLSEQQIVQKYSTGGGATSFAKKVAEKTGFKGVVDTLGTNLANAGVAAKGLANVPGALLGHQASKDRFNKAVATSQELPQTTLAQNIGAGAQLGSLVAGGITGAGVPLALRTAAGAALGAGSLGGQAAAQGEDLGTVGSKAALGAGLGAGVSIAAAGIEKLGGEVFKHFIPRSERDASLLQTYRAKTPFLKRMWMAATGSAKPPKLTEDTAFSNATGKALVGTRGMMGVQARRAQEKIWNSIIDPQLQYADETIAATKTADLFDEARAAIIKNNPELNRQGALLDALKSVSDDYIDKTTIGWRELQKFKEQWAAPIPEKAYLGRYIPGAQNDVRKILSDLARKRITTRLPDGVREAYIDYGNLKGLAELGKKALKGTMLQPGGAQTLFSEIVRTLMSPVANIGGLTIYKVGNAVELIGRPGLNTVGQFLLDSMTESSQQSSQEPTVPPLSRGMSTYPNNTPTK